jgi:multiple sugar transport system substrate-binding protein
MKRFWHVLFTLCIATAFLVACAPGAIPVATQGGQEAGQAAQQRSKVAFWHIFGSGPSRDVFDQMIADFNLENPNYIVEPVFADFWTYEQKVLAAVAAGDPPDVIMADMTRAGQRAEANQILNLDDFMAADNVDLDRFWGYTQRDVVYNGQVWGIPYAPDTRVLYYDKDAFAEVGLDPDQPPQTWDELWEYSQRLDKMDDQGNLERVGFSPMWGNVYVMPFAWSNGATLVDEQGNFMFDSPEVIETAQWYKQWVDHYGKENLDTFASGFGSGAQDPFISGEVAMIIQTQTYIGNLRNYAADKNWGVTLIPNNGTPASWGAGFDLEIPMGASNPEGAWEFIKFLTSKESQVKFAQASGWMPSLVEAAQDPALAETPGWDVVLESMAITQSRPFVLEAPTWYGFLISAFQEVWDGVKTPEEALADAQAAVEKEVANYRETRR